MSDFERYGDYNEIEEAPKKSIVGVLIKAVILILCAAVIGLIAFRLIVFNHYPDEITNLYFTDELTEHYNATDGEIGALTQELLNSTNYGYDDSKDGNFFAKNLIVIPDTGELQVTLRYNTSLMKSIEEDFGVSLDPDSRDNFSFRLVGMRASDTVSADGTDSDYGNVIDCELKAAVYASNFMYRYIKLSFDGVDLAVGTPDAIDWLRLEISLNGIEIDEPYMILIYYNTDKYPLIPYELSAKEKPD